MGKSSSMPLLESGKQEINLTTRTLRVIIFGFLPFLALVHPIYVVPGKVGPHPMVQDIYAPKDPKDVGQTLG